MGDFSSTTSANEAHCCINPRDSVPKLLPPNCCTSKYLQIRSFLVDVKLSNRTFNQADCFIDNSNLESGTIIKGGLSRDPFPAKMVQLPMYRQGWYISDNIRK